MTNKPAPMLEAELLPEFDSKAIEYYRAYFRNDLGLPGCEQHINSSRFKEEVLTRHAWSTLLAIPVFRCTRTVSSWSGARPLPKCSTSRVNLEQRCKGIKLVDSVIDTCLQKARLLDSSSDHVQKQVAEHMTCSRAHFDLIIFLQYLSMWLMSTPFRAK